MFKKIIKIMACISLCLSMVVPLSVNASNSLTAPEPYGDGTDKSVYPYYYLIYYETNAIYIYSFLYSKDKIILTNQYSYTFDYNKYIADGLIYRRDLIMYKSDGRVVWETPKGWTGSHASDVISANYDLCTDDGTVIFKGTNSDNPPQPDVPTDTSWSEILASAFLPMILAVIGGMALWMLCSRLLKLLRTLCNRYLRG